MEYLSKQRHDEIVAELNHLIHEVYPKVTEDLAEASAQGDRSDNAGYREARRMQGKKVGEIAEAKTPTGVLKLLVESITQA